MRHKSGVKEERWESAKFAIASGKYKSIVEEEKKQFAIPVDGSLGLLALGYRGVVAWRKVRDEAQREEMESQDTGSE